MVSDRPDIQDVQNILDAIPEVNRAPWSDAQIRSLNEFQLSGSMHPFTCAAPHVYAEMIPCPECVDDPGHAREPWDGRPVACPACHGLARIEGPAEDVPFSRYQHIMLTAMADGWHCFGESCDYTQDWAWPFMVNGEWRQTQALISGMTKGVGEL